MSNGTMTVRGTDLFRILRDGVTMIRTSIPNKTVCLTLLYTIYGVDSSLKFSVTHQHGNEKGRRYSYVQNV